MKKLVLSALFVVVVSFIGSVVFDTVLNMIGEKYIVETGMKNAQNELEEEGYNVLVFDQEELIIEKDGLMIKTIYNENKGDFTSYWSTDGKTWKLVTD